MHLWTAGELCDIIIILAVLAGLLIGVSAPQAAYERGTYDGMRYACRYAVTMTDGVTGYDKSLCVGRLENGQYFEIDNGVIAVGR